MTKCIEYNQQYQQNWDNFVKNAKNGLFMFERSYMEYHSDRFVDNSLLFFDDDKLIAFLPLNKKENELFSHGGLTFGGFISAEKMRSKKMLDCFEVLITYMKQNNFKKLTYKAIPYIYYKYPSQEDIYALAVNGANILRTDISTTIDLGNILPMPKGRKASIKKAIREGVLIEESKDYSSFMDLEKKVLEERHGVLPVHTAEELSLLSSRFPENIKLFVAKKDNKIIAGSVVYIYENVVHTQYLASSDVGRTLGALDLVINELITNIYSDKRYFDFGISNNPKDSTLNEGLISQKESFGGRAVIHQIWELKVN